MEVSIGSMSLILLLLALVFVFKTVNVVPQQHAWVVERLGKFHAVLGPGLNIVVPFVDRIAYKHVLKEIPLDVPPQVCITRDNTQLQVDGYSVFSDYRCDACFVWLVELYCRHYAVGANDLAFGDR